MATGVLGQSNPAANTNTTVYTVTTGLTGSTSVTISNLDGLPALVSFAVSATGTPAASEWVFFDKLIPGYSSIEKSGIVAQAGKNFVVIATTANVAVSVYGYEA